MIRFDSQMALAGEFTSVRTERWAREAKGIVSLASVEALVHFCFLNVFIRLLSTLDRLGARNRIFHCF